MTRPLSNDLRQRVVGAVAGGMSRRAAAEPVRDGRLDGDQMGSAVAQDGQFPTPASGRGQALAPH